MLYWSSTAAHIISTMRMLCRVSGRAVTATGAAKVFPPVAAPTATSSLTRRCFTSQYSPEAAPETAKQRVLSGIQPTGKLHLGNYAGALKQWVDNQYKYDNYFCVVDLHAITNMHDKTRLRQETLQAAAMYIAAGIDPKESCIFIQSHIPAHAELTWLLNCVTPMSWLGRMIQFKEKSKGNEEGVSVGLLDYPVLMAADILLYQAQLVPVGEDQRQHLELARDICRRFNDQYPSQSTIVHATGSDDSTASALKKREKGRKVSPVFREPKSLVMQEGARLMSLQDGTCKMSKSHESDATRINLLDSPDVILKKIKRCKTDNVSGDMTFGDPTRPECTNLLTIYQTMTGGERVGEGNRSKEEIEREVRGMQWGQFKPLLAEAIVEHLAPLQREYSLLMRDEVYIEQVLRDGRLKAAATAEKTLKDAKQALGFYIPTI